jgi:tetratricopeptide (TPR) repeat protein
MSNILVAQQTAIDSLNNLLKKNLFKNNKEHLKTMDDLCDLLIETNLEKAMPETRNFLKLAKQLQVEDFEATALESIGTIFYIQGRNDSALFYFGKGLNWRIKKKPDIHFFETQNNIAGIFGKMGKYDTAISLYTNVRKYFESVDNQIRVGQILANIGILYHSTGNLDKATDFTLKALEIQKKAGEKEGTGVSLVNLMLFANDKREYDKAIKYGENALAILKHQNHYYYGDALLRVGISYQGKKDNIKAIRYITESIKICKENNNIAGLAGGYVAMANYYLGLKQYKKAKEFGLNALEIADTTNRDDYISLNHALKQACTYLKEPTEADHYSNTEIRLIEENCKKLWAEKIADADAKYQTEKKEKDILKLRNEKQISGLIIKRRNILIYALFSTLSLLLSISLLLYRNVHNKRVIVEKENEIQKHTIRELENEKMLLATQSVL